MSDRVTGLNRAAVGRALALLEPWRRLTSPVFLGLDHIPEHERPLLFVGNHTVWGLLDTPLLFAELFQKKGIFLRALGDHAHFKIPVWGQLLRGLGVVDGTRASCDRLMRAGEAILVFPGGGREVAKRKGEKYKLIWKERIGFARMALRHRCTIVPFAAVGAEDALDVVADSGDLMASPIGRLLETLRFRVEVVPPLVKGVGPTPLPRPERFYFTFRPPIATGPWADRADEETAARDLRDYVRASVGAGIDELLAVQAADPHRGLLARINAGRVRSARARRRRE